MYSKVCHYTVWSDYTVQNVWSDYTVQNIWSDYAVQNVWSDLIIIAFFHHNLRHMQTNSVVKILLHV